MQKIMITNKKKITPKHHEHEQYEYNNYEVNRDQMITAFYSLPPKKSNYPFHYHIANEEIIYVISGNGILETFDEKYEITEGDIVVCPVGEKGAHKITNSSETEEFIYLDIDTNNKPDVVYYPHSNKLGIRGDGISDNYSLDSKIDYYDKE